MVFGFAVVSKTKTAKNWSFTGTKLYTDMESAMRKAVEERKKENMEAHAIKIRMKDNR